MAWEAWRLWNEMTGDNSPISWAHAKICRRGGMKRAIVAASRRLFADLSENLFRHALVETFWSRRRRSNAAPEVMVSLAISIASPM